MLAPYVWQEKVTPILMYELENKLGCIVTEVQLERDGGVTINFQSDEKICREDVLEVIAETEKILNAQ